MSYTKSVLVSLFDDGARLVSYYKNGRLCAFDNGDGRGIQLVPMAKSSIELTRAQGYRYWAQHFPGRTCYSLPALLEEAVDREPQSYGSFVTRNGERIGYIG